MNLSWAKNFWVISLILTICGVLGDESIETTTMTPKELLDVLKKANGSEIKDILKNSRRIVQGREVKVNRPYMVYLKLPPNNIKFQNYKRWLCGGVIIHELYILTSAACIEDVKHFYVVTGTDKFSYQDDAYSNMCIKNGAKKAVWKCIPKNYVFDGHENDNIRWMNNDIAIVKLEDELDFTRRVRGCDYIPRPICYNNQSQTLENPGNVGSIAGWGSTDKYSDWINARKNARRDMDSQALLEAPVSIIEKPLCKKRWGRRYHNIIDNYMICTNDLTSEISEICLEKYVDCTEITGESEENDGGKRRDMNPDDISVHSSNHNYSISRRQSDHIKDGGFCENDHGGPLVSGSGIDSVVIGVISACLVKEKTNTCYGPFLYTSIYKNRVLINCAIYKDIGTDCNKMFRAGETHEELEMSWTDHPDGPAKSEIKAMRRRKEQEEKLKNLAASQAANASATATDGQTKAPDSVVQVTKSDIDLKNDKPVMRSGVVIRDHDEEDETSKTNNASAAAIDAQNKAPVPVNVTITQNSVVQVIKSDIDLKNDKPVMRSGVIIRDHDEENELFKTKNASAAATDAQNKVAMPENATITQDSVIQVNNSTVDFKNDVPVLRSGVVIREHNKEDEKNEAKLAKVKQAIAAKNRTVS